MAYVATNPPRVVISGPFIDGRLWIYKSADIVGDVDAANYFSNGDALGMKVGDPVIVVDTATPKATMTVVSAVTAGGAATVVQ